MNKLLAGGVILSFLAHAWEASAQPDARNVLSSLQERGQNELTANWRSIGVTHKSAVFLHGDVRKAANGQLAVWTHQELPAAEYIDKEKPYLSLRERMVVDCKALRFGISDQAYYAEHFARGALVGTNRTRNVDMQETVPDSIEELLVKTICAPKPRKAPPAKVKTKSKTKDESSQKDDAKAKDGAKENAKDKVEKKPVTKQGVRQS